MIAGTYTPFTTLCLKGAWAIGLTALVWSGAAMGIALKHGSGAGPRPALSRNLFDARLGRV
jgi:channel protein (hemolysin III family)